MDLNPHKFLTSYSAYEFSNHALSSSTELLLLSMAWLTHMPASSLKSALVEPDLDTLGYWLGRLQPLVENVGKEVIVVVANRCGEEEPDARYAGTSWIGKVGEGKAGIWGMVGRGEEGLVVGDMDEPVKWVVKLREQEKSGQGNEEDEE